MKGKNGLNQNTHSYVIGRQGKTLSKNSDDAIKSTVGNERPHTSITTKKCLNKLPCIPSLKTQLIMQLLYV